MSQGSNTPAEEWDVFASQETHDTILKALDDCGNRLAALDRQRDGIYMEIGELLRAAREHNDSLPAYRQRDRVEWNAAAGGTGLSRPTLYKLEREIPDDSGTEPTLCSNAYLARTYRAMGDDYPGIAAELRARHPHLGTLEAVMGMMTGMWHDENPDWEFDPLGPLDQGPQIPGVAYVERILAESLKQIESGPLGN